MAPRTHRLIIEVVGVVLVAALVSAAVALAIIGWIGS